MLAIALLTYALITPRDSFTHGSFNSDDVQIIREAYGPHVFWFRSDDGTYLIFDEKALAQLDELFRPQRELAWQQANLGSKQAELGAQQAHASSSRQSELSRRQESLSQEQARLSEKQSALSREVGKKLSALTDEWIRSGVAKPLSR